jgi:hypothetical protein
MNSPERLAGKSVFSPGEPIRKLLFVIMFYRRESKVN